MAGTLPPHSPWPGPGSSRVRAQCRGQGLDERKLPVGSMPSVEPVRELCLASARRVIASTQPVEQPGGTDREGADALHPRLEEPVGGDHGDPLAPVASTTGLLDDGRVAVPARVHGQDVAVPTRLDAALGGAFQYEYDEVVRQVRDQQRLVEPASGARTVLPPAVRAGTDDVGRVDDQDGHLRNLLKSFGSSRFAAAVS